MSSRILRVSLVILFVAGYLLNSFPALAISIGVTPGKIVFNMKPGSTLLQTLQVINQDNQTADFEVYVKGNNNGWFTVSPGKFTLDGHGQQNVTIEAAPPMTARSGEFDLRVCVISLSPDSELRIGAGVKVPVQLQVIECPRVSWRWWIAATVFFSVVMLVVLIWWRRKEKRA